MAAERDTDYKHLVDPETDWRNVDLYVFAGHYPKCVPMYLDKYIPQIFSGHFKHDIETGSLVGEMATKGIGFQVSGHFLNDQIDMFAEPYEESGIKYGYNRNQGFDFIKKSGVWRVTVTAYDEEVDGDTQEGTVLLFEQIHKNAYGLELDGVDNAVGWLGSP